MIAVPGPERGLVRRFARAALVPVVVLGASCGPPRTSMLSYQSLVTSYRAEVFVDGPIVAIRGVHRPGLALVIWEPVLESHTLVFNGGIASAGSGAPFLQCFRIDDAEIASEPNLALAWREPDGRRTAIEAVTRGAAASEHTRRCVDIRAARR